MRGVCPQKRGSAGSETLAQTLRILLAAFTNETHQTEAQAPDEGPQEAKEQDGHEVGGDRHPWIVNRPRTGGRRKLVADGVASP